jgi:phosphatidylserine/phosphatidylglycerophosphate/cardiolipin synthase-like enzyme
MVDGSFVKRLLDVAPTFPVNPSKISLLSTPNEFLERVLVLIEQSRRRIGISTLYVGCENYPEELKLLEAISQKLQISCNK